MSDYPEWFSEIWANKPNREGGNSKKGAYKAALARIKQGDATEEELLAGTVRYNNYCIKRNLINSRFVMQIQTFFGPSCHFEEEWAVYETHQQPNQLTERQSASANFQQKLQQYAAATGHWAAHNPCSNDMERISGHVRSEGR